MSAQFCRSVQDLTIMKFATLATLFAAVPCLFTVVQAQPCGGGPLNRIESDALRTYGGALFRLYFATPINNSMSACFCYVSDKNGCLGSMCAACNNSGYSEEDFIKYCRQAVHAITSDVGPGSNAWCDYPGLKGLKMVNYWKQNITSLSTLPLFLVSKDTDYTEGFPVPEKSPPN